MRAVTTPRAPRSPRVRSVARNFLTDRWRDGQYKRQRRRVERDEVRRFTRRSRTRRNWLLATLGVVVFVGGFVAYMIWSPATVVREVQVTGVSRIPETQVQDALAELHGVPLAQLGTADVGARLEPIVLVQSYSLQVVPPGTIVVDIVERTPIGVIPTNEGFVAVDAAGVQLWTDAAPPADLPKITPGGTKGPGFPSAAAVSLALPTEFRATIDTIDATTMDNVKLQLRDGTTVVWGSSEGSAKKAEVLLALVKATEGSASLYDVSSPDAPVTR